MTVRTKAGNTTSEEFEAALSEILFVVDDLTRLVDGSTKWPGGVLGPAFKTVPINDFVPIIVRLAEAERKFRPLYDDLDLSTVPEEIVTLANNIGRPIKLGGNYVNSSREQLAVGVRDYAFPPTFLAKVEEAAGIDSLPRTVRWVAHSAEVLSDHIKSDQLYPGPNPKKLFKEKHFVEGQTAVTASVRQVTALVKHLAEQLSELKDGDFGALSPEVARLYVAGSGIVKRAAIDLEVKSIQVDEESPDESDLTMLVTPRNYTLPEAIVTAALQSVGAKFEPVKFAPLRPKGASRSETRDTQHKPNNSKPMRPHKRNRHGLA